MIVIRFKVQCRPDRIEEAVRAFAAVVPPSREVEGVVSFDIARDVVDPNSIVAVEVFEDDAARERQESLPEVGAVTRRRSSGSRPRKTRSRRPDAERSSAPQPLTADTTRAGAVLPLTWSSSGSP